jgi:hypothetical protein
MVVVQVRGSNQSTSATRDVRGPGGPWRRVLYGAWSGV